MKIVLFVHDAQWRFSEDLNEVYERNARIIIIIFVIRQLVQFQHESYNNAAVERCVTTVRMTEEGERVQSKMHVHNCMIIFF